MTEGEQLVTILKWAGAMLGVAVPIVGLMGAAFVFFANRISSGAATETRVRALEARVRVLEESSVESRDESRAGQARIETHLTKIELMIERRLAPLEARKERHQT